ncbi:hypothetical protein BAUCODRAFT_489934 [Baudoinia panamericana UAMH 10762]|uniref:Uncharacterized protein n=1 Tax=Baudoinia panamericana (strain UAMH 10762) TaxID=717646 RepID=M2MJC5_BAUPA|nr:uncharacterized protein BAUCODRAFT_489934 [Baudoinia panamericana UAMH 10762]EMC96786.1 hypothetical protein BAUCODRAFT_489934 [Baudoinia panamericana UAMH 10762]
MFRGAKYPRRLCQASLAPARNEHLLRSGEGRQKAADSFDVNELLSRISLVDQIKARELGTVNRVSDVPTQNQRCSISYKAQMLQGRGMECFQACKLSLFKAEGSKVKMLQPQLTGGR